jgi:hypothetical protein
VELSSGTHVKKKILQWKKLMKNNKINNIELRIDNQI